jgi:transposase
MSKTVLGIDIGKKELSIALLKNEHFFCRTVANSEAGFTEIEKFVSSKTSEQPEVYMEATGHYHSAVADYLFDRGYIIKVVNPRKIHSFAGVKLSRNKTDKADAKIIARYGVKFDDDRPYKKLPKNVRKIRALYRTYLGLIDQAKMCKNHLESAIDKDATDYWKESLKNFEIQIKKIVKQIVSIIEAESSLSLKFKNLQTIPGIAKITAIAVLSEIGNIEDFLSARQLAAYLGATPKHKESGTSVHGKAKMSKMGNAILRKALFLPSITASNICEPLQKYKQKQKAKEKKAKQIIIAIMKKIIYAIYVVLKKGSIFNENLLFKNA